MLVDLRGLREELCANCLTFPHCRHYQTVVGQAKPYMYHWPMNMYNSKTWNEIHEMFCLHMVRGQWYVGLFFPTLNKMQMWLNAICYNNKNVTIRKKCSLPCVSIYQNAARNFSFLYWLDLKFSPKCLGLIVLNKNTAKILGEGNILDRCIHFIISCSTLHCMACYLQQITYCNTW